MDNSHIYQNSEVIETIRNVRDRLDFLLTHRHATPPDVMKAAIDRCAQDLQKVAVR